jgi:hypothetical protein
MTFAFEFVHSGGMTSLVDALNKLLNGLRGELSICAHTLRKIEQQGDYGLAQGNDFGQQNGGRIGSRCVRFVQQFKQRIVYKCADTALLFGGKRDN